MNIPAPSWPIKFPHRLPILIIAIDNLTGGSISSRINRLTFFCEAAALIAFGIAWLSASRILPLITSGEERLSLSPFGSREGKQSVDAK